MDKNNENINYVSKRINTEQGDVVSSPDSFSNRKNNKNKRERRNVILNQDKFKKVKKRI